MKYWADFTNKRGFFDGEIFPIGVLQIAITYKNAVNAVAEKWGSLWIAELQDFETIHNPFRFVFIKQEEKAFHPADTDPVFQAAVQEVQQLDLDKYIELYDVQWSTYRAAIDHTAIERELEKLLNEN